MCDGMPFGNLDVVVGARLALSLMLHPFSSALPNHWPTSAHVNRRLPLMLSRPLVRSVLVLVYRFRLGNGFPVASAELLITLTLPTYSRAGNAPLQRLEAVHVGDLHFPHDVDQVREQPPQRDQLIEFIVVGIHAELALDGAHLPKIRQHGDVHATCAKPSLPAPHSAQRAARFRPGERPDDPAVDAGAAILADGAGDRNLLGEV